MDWIASKRVEIWEKRKRKIQEKSVDRYEWSSASKGTSVTMEFYPVEMAPTAKPILFCGAIYQLVNHQFCSVVPLIDYFSKGAQFTHLST